MRRREFSPFWIGLNRRADSRHCCRHWQAISDLSFSHNGEYLAIAGAGNYIDIVRHLFLSPFPRSHKCLAGNTMEYRPESEDETEDI